jgi:hypothetical protein
MGRGYGVEVLGTWVWVEGMGRGIRLLGMGRGWVEGTCGYELKGYVGMS